MACRSSPSGRAGVYTTTDLPWRCLFSVLLLFLLGPRGAHGQVDIKGNLKIVVQNVSNAVVKNEFSGGVAMAVGAIGKIPQSWVQVEVSRVFRRLARRLSSGTVRAVYDVTIPAMSNFDRATVKNRLEGATTAQFTAQLRQTLVQAGYAAASTDLVLEAEIVSGSSTGGHTDNSDGGITSGGADVTIDTSGGLAGDSGEESSRGMDIIVIVIVIILALLLLGGVVAYYGLNYRLRGSPKIETLYSKADAPSAVAAPAPAPAPISYPTVVAVCSGGEDDPEGGLAGAKAAGGGAAHPPSIHGAKAFEDTKYLQIYRRTEVAQNVFDGVTSINSFLDAIQVKHHLDVEAVQKYKSKVGGSLLDKGLKEVSEMGTYLWTTADTLSDGKKDRELCNYINEAIRGDETPFVDSVVPLARIINCCIVTANRGSSGPKKWPSNNTTYRGSGMPVWARDFFVPGRIYRIPMFLATSFKESTARDFMVRMSGGELKPTMFILHFDPERRCAHANYLGDITAVDGEAEFLMPPYSGFQVMSADWSQYNKSVVHIKVFPDNKDPRLDRCALAPWH